MRIPRRRDSWSLVRGIAGLIPLGGWLVMRSRGLAVQYVGESTMQPEFVRCTLVVTLHRLAEHMRVMSTESGDFLFKPCASTSHQVFITGVPQFIAMQESAWDAVARGFDNVFSSSLLVENCAEQNE